VTTRINESKTLGLLAAAAIGIAALLPTAHADERPISLEASADVVSKYVWRGMLLTDDPVVQPGLTLSGYGLSLNVWGSVDLTDLNENDIDAEYRLQELDYTASYAISPMEGLDLEGGFIWYTFPGTVFDDTGEVYGSVALSSIPLSPTLTVYYDVDEVEGYYGTFALGHSFELTEALSLDLGASIAYADEEYNEAYFGVDDDGLNDLALSASLSYTVNEYVAVSATVGYSEILDNDIEDTMDDSDHTTVGLNITFSY